MKLHSPDTGLAARPAYRGGASTFLYEHRALARRPHPARTLAGALVLTVATVAAWAAVLPFVGLGWGYALAAVASASGEVSGVVMTVYDGWGVIEVGVPHLVLEAGLPGRWVWEATAFVAILLFAVSFFLPERMLPGMYALRLVLLIQASALVYFALWAEHFPYTLSDYLQTMMPTGLAIATAAPLVLGLTWHVQDVAWTKKLALVLVIQAYSVVLVPLQYAAHGLVLHHASLLFMPLLYILFGIPLHVLTLVALYAWGMSWEGSLPVLGVPADIAPTSETTPLRRAA